MEARQYQTEAVEQTWDYLRQHKDKRPLVVLPTGAGKSWIIAMLCHRAAAHNGRVLIVAHRKELLKQNAEKVSALLEDGDVGFYSAGLNRRDTDSQFLAAGIQSIYRKPAKMGVRNLIIVDEAHLISNDPESLTMYHRLISAYPEARLVGLTATPYRTSEGPIYGKSEKKTFDAISYEARVESLINEGYLCPITRSPTSTVKMTNVGVRAGDFVPGQMERVYNEPTVVDEACNQIAALTGGRKSVLIFCCGVKHSYSVQEKLEGLLGVEVGCVTGETPAIERASLLHRFGTGDIRFMVNCDVLTTGFDSPRIDCVCVLRSTMSPGLFVQMVGRGFRPHDSKDDCLLLDFGGNRVRHGDPDTNHYGYAIKKKPEDEDSDDEAEVPENNTRGTLCPECEGDIPPGERECPHCGFIPKDPERRKANHEAEPDLETTVTWNVEEISYHKHVKRGSGDNDPATLRVEYTVRKEGDEGNLQTRVCKEWVCFEHQGFALEKAWGWWQQRSKHPAPVDTDEALDLIGRHAIRGPHRIVTEKDGRWRRIVQILFKDPRPHRDDLQPAEVIPEGAGWADNEVPF